MTTRSGKRTICVSGLQVSIQVGQDVLVEGLHGLCWDASGPNLQGVQGCVCQRGVAQAKL